MHLPAITRTAAIDGLDSTVDGGAYKKNKEREKEQKYENEKEEENGRKAETESSENRKRPTTRHFPRVRPSAITLAQSVYQIRRPHYLIKQGAKLGPPTFAVPLVPHAADILLPTTAQRRCKACINGRRRRPTGR
jgi:hypothetical protein